MISVLWLQALAIDTEDDIHLLASYFMQLKGKQAQGDAEEKVRTSVMGFIVIFVSAFSCHNPIKQCYLLLAEVCVLSICYI